MAYDLNIQIPSRNTCFAKIPVSVGPALETVSPKLLHKVIKLTCAPVKLQKRNNSSADVTLYYTTVTQDVTKNHIIHNYFTRMRLIL